MTKTTCELGWNPPLPRFKKPEEVLELIGLEGERRQKARRVAESRQMYCFVVWQQTAHPLELQTLESNPTFDILIIEGGTSSKSTKPVYGGVRYLQKVFMEADWSGGSSSAKPSPSRVRHIPLCGMLPISAVLIYLLPARYRSQL
ncbi:hypothetical protein C8J56DRAFT_899286 [Mycena floridula]|nr:hypothetical protein C8J56DRAFT_899286 [Mycena floridula]